MISPDDARLTAYASGDLSADDAARFETELAHDPAARAEVARLRALQTDLSAAFAEEVATAAPMTEPKNKLVPFTPTRVWPSWLNPLLAAACVVLVAGALILPSVGTVRESSRRSVEASNLRQIGQASLIFSSDNQDKLPGALATDVWDYARLAALQGGLNDGTIWTSPSDPASHEQSDALSTVLTPDRTGIEPAFAKLKPMWAVALHPDLTANSPSTTPIAWTRGLQPDGTWAPHSPNGTAGGYIVFLGGNVSFYRNTERAFVRADGKGLSSDIRDALPPGSRISEYTPTERENTIWSAENTSRLNASALSWRDVLSFGVFFAILLLILTCTGLVIVRGLDRLRSRHGRQRR